MYSLDRDVGLRYTSNLVTIVYRDGKPPNVLYYKSCLILRGPGLIYYIGQYFELIATPLLYSCLVITGCSDHVYVLTTISS
jgi:hypothetical protein